MTKPIDLDELPESSAERLALAVACLSRPDIRHAGLDALRKTYPHAPDAVLRTAVHHLYGDLPEALCDMLAVAELSLRTPGREIGFGAPYHAIDHLYNFLHFRALLPDGMAGMRELVAELQLELAAGDLEAATATAAELRDRVEGNLSAPDGA
jgi:hypothetical protein